MFPIFLSRRYSYVVQKMKNSKKKLKPHTTGVATLYRSSKFQCVWENHRSRTLLVGLKPTKADKVDNSVSGAAMSSATAVGGREKGMDDSKRVSAEEDGELVYVANCHLEGGLRFDLLYECVVVCK